ncbi:MAG: hypothetical protein H7245_11785 [Candidatus Saccharibacteria bacterium]|nr:hypothetical protein [Pseudorhodobacter sp.]
MSQSADQLRDFNALEDTLLIESYVVQNLAGLSQGAVQDRNILKLRVSDNWLYLYNTSAADLNEGNVFFQ